MEGRAYVDSAKDEFLVLGEQRQVCHDCR
jgi:hypothetical protein